MTETGFVGFYVCPGCEPEADPVAQGQILTIRWCDGHAPSIAGSEDGIVPGEARYLSTSGEADGHDCRAMAELLRGPR